MNFYKKQNFILIVLLYLISVFITTIYRRYIYKYKKEDVFLLADIGNNILFVPSIYLLTILINKKPFYGKYIDIIFIFLIFSFIEITSKFVKGIGTYDIKDIVGLFIGAIIAFLLLKFNIINVPKS